MNSIQTFGFNNFKKIVNFLIDFFILLFIRHNIAVNGILGISGVVTAALTEKLRRKKRVNVSKNFQEFVKRYSIERLSFVPSQEDLTNSTLHDIYASWKKTAKAILNT